MLLRFARLPKRQLVTRWALALGLASGAARLPAQEAAHSLCKERPLNASPVGSQVNRFMAVQAANAEPAKFIFFPNEWYMGGCELGPMGCRHLFAVAQAAPAADCPIVVETSGDQLLDETRRTQLVAGLERFGVSDAGRRVVVHFPATTILRGEQAELTYQSWLVSGRNDLNHGLYNGFGAGSYLGGPGLWGQGYWGMGVGGGYGYAGLLAMPFRN